ncbi:MAG: hypothetical protein ACI4PC_09035 [Oscillospiraceae bacterium]
MSSMTIYIEEDSERRLALERVVSIRAVPGGIVCRDIFSRVFKLEGTITYLSASHSYLVIRREPERER